MTFIRRAGAACALLGLAFATPASAACWADQDRDAVSVRELQTMLMVASLRCHAVGIDILPAYNGFVQASREAIEAANQRIKRHFADEGGAQADYDRFTTSLANAYGAETTNAAACAEAAQTAADAAASAGDLRRIAASRIFPRALPGGGCSAPAPAQVVTIAAPAAPAAVIALPEDVVAALAVLARYNAGAKPEPKPAEAPTRLAQLPQTAAR